MKRLRFWLWRWWHEVNRLDAELRADVQRDRLHD